MGVGAEERGERDAFLGGGVVVVVVGEREGMLARGWIGSVCVYVYV